MSKVLMLLFFVFMAGQAIGQQLYLEIFSGRNTQRFDKAPYTGKSGYYPLGLRAAFGADHFQLGGEYSQHITRLDFTIRDTITEEVLGRHRFSSKYYGIFLRGKYSRYPARRFGLTFVGGAGYYTLQRTSTVSGGEPKLAYTKTPSLNGGIGISIPTQGMGMIELGYHYYYVQLDEQNELPAMQASYHSIHLGFSLNFVFGKRAKEYEKIGKI